MRVVVGGGSGFVGSAFVRSLVADGHEAVVVSRDPAKVDLPASTVAWKEVTRGGAGAVTRVRDVVVRSPFVVGPGARAVSLMALPFRLLFGGPIGNGAAWFPWIHVDDLARIYRRAVEDESLEGPVNAVAPHKLRQ